MTTSALKVMQVYSDRRGSLVASKACRRLHEDCECLQTSWNTELLRSPKLRAIAAREAADSDVVVLVLNEGIELSPEIAQWLKAWRRHTPSKRAALIALLRRESSCSGRPIQEALQQFASSAKMNFFCHSRVDVNPHRSIEDSHHVFC
jgi:hypothetical protein